MLEMKRLKEVMMNNISDYGIFTALQTFNPPWDYDNSLLNIEYHYNYSGEKFISPLLDALLNGKDKLSQEDINILASVLDSLYMEKWTKLYDTLHFEYNPIDNYNMKENSTDATTFQGSSNSSNSENGTRTSDATYNENNENKVSAFNSVDYQDNALNVVDNNSTSTVNNTNEVENNTTTNNTENLTHSLTRSGNIGVTTTQKMITEERSVRMWDYFKIIFADVDEILTIKYYGGV